MYNSGFSGDKVTNLSPTNRQCKIPKAIKTLGISNLSKTYLLLVLTPTLDSHII